MAQPLAGGPCLPLEWKSFSPPTAARSAPRSAAPSVAPAVPRLTPRPTSPAVIALPRPITPAVSPMPSRTPPATPDRAVAVPQSTVPRPVAAFLGDSYTTGWAGAGIGKRGWPAILVVPGARRRLSTGPWREPASSTPAGPASRSGRAWRQWSRRGPGSCSSLPATTTDDWPGSHRQGRHGRPPPLAGCAPGCGHRRHRPHLGPRIAAGRDLGDPHRAEAERDLDRRRLRGPDQGRLVRRRRAAPHPGRRHPPVERRPSPHRWAGPEEHRRGSGEARGRVSVPRPRRCKDISPIAALVVVEPGPRASPRPDPVAARFRKRDVWG